jgi:hypothetical protein
VARVPGNPFRQLRTTLRQTRVVRFPKHRLSTFGDSEIHYQLVSAVSEAPPLSTLRTGRVVALRPQILTPETLAQRFEGFGEEGRDFESFLKENFSDSFRGLEYNFKNVLESAEQKHLDARELAGNIQKDLDAREVARAAVILGPESGWAFSLMKFILEETSQSFAANLRELEDRGFFNADAAEERRRREVDFLLGQARGNPTLVPMEIGRASCRERVS